MVTVVLQKRFDQQPGDMKVIGFEVSIVVGVPETINTDRVYLQRCFSSHSQITLPLTARSWGHAVKQMRHSSCLRGHRGWGFVASHRLVPQAGVTGGNIVRGWSCQSENVVTVEKTDTAERHTGSLAYAKYMSRSKLSLSPFILRTKYPVDSAGNKIVS